MNDTRLIYVVNEGRRQSYFVHLEDAERRFEKCAKAELIQLEVINLPTPQGLAVAIARPGFVVSSSIIELTND